MKSLSDFGYDTMTVNKVEARGHRPLLMVLVEFDGGAPLAHSAAYYDELVFNPFVDLGLGTLGRSVNGYYMNVTGGRFQWSRASDVIGPLRVPADLAGLKLDDRLARLIPMVAAAGYDFSRVDANDDSAIGADELSVLVVDNGSTSSGQTVGPVRCRVATQKVGDVTVHASFVGSRPSLMLIAHELSHQLGTLDLYGHDGNRNAAVTLMGFEPGDDDMRTWHLDPWHKTRLGWAEPILWRLDTYGSHTLAVANSLRADAALIVYDDVRGLNEFFVIEYRSRSAMDEYVPSRSPGGGQIRFNYDADVAGDGVAIWHVYLVDGEPIELTVSAPGLPRKTDKSVFLDSAPAFVHGDNNLWATGQTTPPLRWLDGTATNTRLRIGGFDATSKDVVIELLAPMITTPVPKSTDRPTDPDPRDGRISTSRSAERDDPRFGKITRNHPLSDR